jgi:hypothetical protein
VRAAPDQVAGLDLRRADQSVDRSGDPGVAKVERGLLDRGLGGVDLRARRVARREGVVQLALADRRLLGERQQARDVGVGLLEPGLRGSEVRLRVGKSGLERQRIDLVEEVTLAHERALGERHLVQVALDAGADLDVLRAARLADHFHEHRNVLLDHLGHVHLGRRPRLLGGLLAARQAEHGHGGQGEGCYLRWRAAMAKIVYHGASLCDANHDRPGPAGRGVGTCVVRALRALSPFQGVSC